MHTLCCCGASQPVCWHSSRRTSTARGIEAKRSPYADRRHGDDGHFERLNIHSSTCAWPSGILWRSVALTGIFEMHLPH